MLTLPVVAGNAGANPSARILVIGRSPTVLSELVTILRDGGYAAGATNEFERTLDLFDVRRLDLVVFGGKVPADTREHLRDRISTRNPAVAFVQGHAGIPGLVAAQVEEALGHGTPEPTASVTYDGPSRSIVPPEPRSTSRVILDERLPAGEHTITIPDEVPTQASFATVAVGSTVRTFSVGPMPRGTTTARRDS
jgi:hypothetical protein